MVAEEHGVGADVAFHVASPQAPMVVDVAHRRGVQAVIAGHLEDGSRRVIMRSKGVAYQGAVAARSPWPSTNGNLCYYALRRSGTGCPERA